MYPLVSAPLANESFQIVEARIRTLARFVLPRAFSDSSMGPFANYSFATVQLRDADGFEGESFAVTVPTIESILLPQVIRGERLPYSVLYHDMYWSIRNAGFRGPAASALGSVDFALHDLAARRAGKPLHRFLGANRDWATAYGSGGGTNLTDRELLEELTGFVRNGFTTVKMKIAQNFGRDLAKDVARVRAVRKAIGPAIALAVDANQILSADEAVAFANDIADQQIAWFEEPVHSADVNAIRDYCHRAPIPAAFGESERSALVFPQLIEAGVKHLQPIPNQMGGFAEFRHVYGLAKAKGLPVSTPGYSQSNPYFVATCDESDMSEILVSIVGTLAPLFLDSPRLENGRFHLSDRPGWAPRPDWERLGREDRIASDVKFTLANVGPRAPQG